MLRRSSDRRDDATADVSVTLAGETETGEGDSSTLKKLAPLASLSSFRISSMEQQDQDLRSLGSDSVFCENYVDTDEEVAQFSSDSEDVGGGLGGEREIVVEEEREEEEKEEGREEEMRKVSHNERNDVFIENSIHEIGDSESIPMDNVDDDDDDSEGVIGPEIGITGQLIVTEEKEEEGKLKEEEEATNALTVESNCELRRPEVEQRITGGGFSMERVSGNGKRDKGIVEEVVVGGGKRKMEELGNKKEKLFEKDELKEEGELDEPTGDKLR